MHIKIIADDKVETTWYSLPKLGDSGFNIYFPDTIEIAPKCKVMINLGIRCAVTIDDQLTSFFLCRDLVLPRRHLSWQTV